MLLATLIFQLLLHNFSESVVYVYGKRYTVFPNPKKTIENKENDLS